MLWGLYAAAWAIGWTAGYSTIVSLRGEHGRAVFSMLPFPSRISMAVLGPLLNLLTYSLLAWPFFSLSPWYWALGVSLGGWLAASVLASIIVTSLNKDNLYVARYLPFAPLAHIVGSALAGTAWYALAVDRGWL